MWRIFVVSIGLALLVGCGSKRNPSGSVKGTIRYRDQPVNGALLHLYPTSGEGDDLSIPVTQEGTFSSSNIPPGEYKVVVEARGADVKSPIPARTRDAAQAEEMKQKLQQVQGQEAPTIRYPKKYKDITTTDLQCTIQEGEQPLNLELKD